MITLWTPGIPRPQGSKRHIGNGRMVESSRHVYNWRHTIHQTAAATIPQPADGPVNLRVDFVLARPQYLTGKPTPPATKRSGGDIDKLARAVLDALTGIAYLDDSQVVTLWTTKRIAEPDETPGAAITIDTP